MLKVEVAQLAGDEDEAEEALLVLVVVFLGAMANDDGTLIYNLGV